MTKIGIKYCGGCNPKYDRVAFANRVKEQYRHCEVKAVNSNETFDCVVVVSGCHAACASLKDINTRKGFVIVRRDDIDETLKHIQSIQTNSSENSSEVYV